MSRKRRGWELDMTILRVHEIRSATPLRSWFVRKISANCSYVAGTSLPIEHGIPIDPVPLAHGVRMMDGLHVIDWRA